MIRRILTLTQTLQTHNFMVKLGSFEAGYLGSEIREKHCLKLTESLLPLQRVA